MVNELLNSYLKFCDLQSKAESSKVLDLSKETLLYPTTLLPLGEFTRKKQALLKYVPPADSDTADYLRFMLGEEKRGCKTHCPIVKLPHEKDKAETTLSRLYKLRDKENACGGENAFKYLLGELVDNIYQHSEFTTAFVMAQKYPPQKIAEITFFDNGITIPGSFRRQGLGYKDFEAISLAVNGKSTKANRERGYGLSTCLKLTTEGLNGEALIVSESGALYLNHYNQEGFILKNHRVLNGTLVSLRIPSSTAAIDIYNYTQ